MRPPAAGEVRWFHHERYVLEGGYIVPARGSKLAWYDPWRAFETVRSGSVNAPAAYVDLINLIDGIKRKELGEVVDSWRRRCRSVEGRVLRPAPELFELDALRREKLLAWVNANGLLGLLPHAVVSSAFRGKGNAPKLLVWTHHDWATQDVETNVPEEWRDFTILRSLAPGGERIDEDGSVFSKYFPTVSDEGAQRAPEMLSLGRAFWAHYAEPIDDFLWAAVTLRSALLWADPRAGAPKSSTRPPDFMVLEGMLAAVHPAVVVDTGGRLFPAWSSPSLLGHLAMMAMSDVTHLRRLLKCPGCGKAFVAYRSEYCSRTCKVKINMRTYRAKQKHSQSTPREPRGGKTGRKTAKAKTASTAARPRSRTPAGVPSRRR